MAVLGTSSFLHVSSCPWQPNKPIFCFWFPWSPEQAGILICRFWTQAEHPTPTPGYRQWLPPGLQVLENSHDLLVPPSVAHRTPASIPTWGYFPICPCSSLMLQCPRTVPGLYSLSFMNIALSPETKTQ